IFRGRTASSHKCSTRRSGGRILPKLHRKLRAYVLPVTDNRSMEERDVMRRWVETWKRAGPELEAIREREIREADNVQVVAMLRGAMNLATQLPPRTSSGLVEMQRFLAKLGRANGR